MIYVQVVACKTIRFFQDDQGRKAVEAEVAILSRLQHPNIVRYLDVEWSQLQAKLYMEYCDGGSLDHFVGSNWG